MWLRKAFVNNSSANINLLKTQLSKIVQLGGFSYFKLAYLFEKKLKNKALPKLEKHAIKILLNVEGNNSGITLTGNEVKYIIKISL